MCCVTSLFLAIAPHWAPFFATRRPRFAHPQVARPSLQASNETNVIERIEGHGEIIWFLDMAIQVVALQWKRGTAGGEECPVSNGA